ncbi:MAG: hypothetical protein Q7T74_00545 [Candidatus Saccharibacteria bacterium]|nr:hypothetical protein [Candidatus Saccharibacteria bacterium]
MTQSTDRQSDRLWKAIAVTGVMLVATIVATLADLVGDFIKLIS